MHIPDGFLSTPVWLAMDVVSVPAVLYLGRKAQSETAESKVPLLGVMGAFVFAAQMINFPVAMGASGHLVGGALLVATLGPGAAAIVLTAILGLQALVFQDGGILALGANIFNMAIAGVLVAWLPYRLAGARGRRGLGVFLGGFLSVFVAACLALAELALSGVRMPAGVTSVALGVFALTAVLEGVITVAVVGALERMNPGWIQRPAANGRAALSVLAAGAVLLVTVGILFASANPDGLERFAEQVGIAGSARALLTAPLAGYQAALLDSAWLRESVAGGVGLMLIFLVCFVIGRAILRGRSA